MSGYLQGARLQADQLYPVRVDSVFKGAMLEDMGSDKIKEGVDKGTRFSRISIFIATRHWDVKPT